jgi:LTXXQ motif family protein
MSFVSAAAVRTAVFVIALSGAGLWALRAMDANADPPPSEDSSPCAEGRALFAAKLAYLEARISPEPSQAEAWRSFANAMRDSGELDRACNEEPPRPLSVDAGERLQRMEKHAAAMQAMFGAMAKAYVAIAPSLTTAQRDILSRNIAPSTPFPGPFPPPVPGPGLPPRPGDLALNCGPGGPGSHGWTAPWGPAPF